MPIRVLLFMSCIVSDSDEISRKQLVPAPDRAFRDLTAFISFAGFC